MIKGSQWFNINYGEGGGYMKAVYENYDKYLELSRKNRKYAKDNFTFDMMTQKLLEYLDKWGADSAPQQLQLQLPKLKRVGEENEPPKITLPKLKKVDANG